MVYFLIRVIVNTLAAAIVMNIDVAYAQLKELLRQQLAPGDLLDRTAKPLARGLMGRLPALVTATTSLLDDFQRGELAFQVNVNRIDQRVHVVQTAVEQGVRRIVVSVLLVGLLLGSTLTLLIPLEGRVSEFESLAIRRVAEFGFVLAAVLISILLLYALWQSIRKPARI